MARIRLDHVTKKYGSITALKDVSIDVKDNEFYVIFGPAGAGKTAVLNRRAGISDPEEGDILFDDAYMNYVEPRERDVAMVFENYALYPHKTVYENIASSMRTKKAPAAGGSGGPRGEKSCSDDEYIRASGTETHSGQQWAAAEDCTGTCPGKKSECISYG